MSKILEGNLVADKNDKFCIVVSRFNEFIGSKLLEGATDALTRLGCDKENIEIVYVPGAFEIPVACLKLANSKKYSAIITLGAVIRGATSHYEYVSSEVAKGVAQVSVQTGVPVIFGVLTTDNIEQAIERAGTKAGNKGASCAQTAVEMANLFKQI